MTVSRARITPVTVRILLLVWGLFAAISLMAQPVYAPDIQKEKLGRGLVLLRDGDSLVVSWRLLEDENNVNFNVYQEGNRLNEQNINTKTFFKTLAPETETEITLTAIKDNREFRYTQTYHPDLKDYLSIPLSKPADGTTPDGRHYTYSANDASVGDVDGDGEYEIILKWDPSNAKDNSHEGYTGNVYIDCYKIPCYSQESVEKSTPFLWRINLGPNIRAGAHYTQFLVYDFDGDGRAELITKTADGTIDGTGVTIGDANANWVTNGRILNGPEYLTVFDGLTGRALQTVPYQPPRGDVASWGDK